MRVGNSSSSGGALNPVCASGIDTFGKTALVSCKGVGRYVTITRSNQEYLALCDVKAYAYRELYVRWTILLMRFRMHSLTHSLDALAHPAALNLAQNKNSSAISTSTNCFFTGTYRLNTSYVVNPAATPRITRWNTSFVTNVTTTPCLPAFANDGLRQCVDFGQVNINQSYTGRWARTANLESAASNPSIVFAALSMNIDVVGNLYTAGYVRAPGASVSFGTCSSCSASAANMGDSDLVVVKYNNLGTTLWVRRYGVNFLSTSYAHTYIRIH